MEGFSFSIMIQVKRYRTLLSLFLTFYPFFSTTLLYKAGFVGHGIKYRVLVCKQVLRRVEFGNNALVKDQNSVRVHHSVDSVGDGQDRAVGKRASDCALDDSIGFNVNCCSSFIEYQNGGLAKQGTGKADKLSEMLSVRNAIRLVLQSYFFFLT